jgi:death-on-curing family protein
LLDSEELNKVLIEFKDFLIKKGEATDIFGKERVGDAISGIIGNVMQSYGGKNVYPTLEEKAAHILYFFIKNHPFVDGNKRSGAFSFIWFLRKNNLLKISLSPEALTVLTLLIAESNPKNKEKMIKLVLQILKKK